MQTTASFNVEKLSPTMNKKPIRSKPSIKPRTPIGLRTTSPLVKKKQPPKVTVADADEWDGINIEVDELDESDFDLEAAIGG